MQIKKLFYCLMSEYFVEYFILLSFEKYFAEIF